MMLPISMIYVAYLKARICFAVYLPANELAGWCAVSYADNLCHAPLGHIVAPTVVKHDLACRMHAPSITPHKRSAVWGVVGTPSICVPAARALEPSLLGYEKRLFGG